MITFACRCSHKFSVEDDRAGESLQCPACGLLVDVPTIDDLPGLRDDGSYEFSDEAPLKGMPHQMRDTPSILRRDSTDRRQSLKEFLNLGTSESDLLEIKDEVKPGIPKHPKYDPETGELITPLDVRKEVKPAPMMAIPMTLGYEHRAKSTQTSIFAPFAWMFRMPNVVACAVVTLFFLLTFILSSSAFLAIFAPVLIVMLIAHFANVIDETGPTGNDEIPALLRSANIFDDFLRPCCQVVGAYIVAISPIILTNIYVRNLHPAVDFGFSIFMHLMIPAILLTMITSGAFNNLLPSRVFSVIIASGWHYWVVTAIGYVAVVGMFFAIYVGTKCGGALFHVLFRGPLTGVPSTFGVPIQFVLLASPFIVYAAMYLLHVYAWQLGLMYRLHHDQFDWVWQKHDKSERTDVQAQLHAHRQMMLEAKAAQARKAMEERQASTPKIPVAKPADPWRH
jgi:hypothetical protein